MEEEEEEGKEEREKREIGRVSKYFIIIYCILFIYLFN